MRDKARQQLETTVCEADLRRLLTVDGVELYAEAALKDGICA